MNNTIAVTPAQLRKSDVLVSRDGDCYGIVELRKYPELRIVEVTVARDGQTFEQTFRVDTARVQVVAR